MNELQTPDSGVPFEKEHDLGKRPVHEIKLDWPVPGHEVSINLRTDGAMIGDVVVDNKKILTSTEPDTVSQPELAEFPDESGWELVSQDVNDEGLQPQQRKFPSMLQRVKVPVGTITMAPVGTMNRPGIPQHGDWRYRKHETVHSAGRVVEIRTEDPHNGLGHSMTVEQLDDGVQVIDEIVNLSQEPWKGSVGKHNYLATSEEAPKDNPLRGIRLLRADGTEPTFTAQLDDQNGTTKTGTLVDFMPDLLNDRSVLVPAEVFRVQPGEGEPDDLRGRVLVEIPGVGIVTVEAKAESAAGPETVAFWLWHRKDTKSFAVEPMAGTFQAPNGEFANDLIAVAPGETLRMTSSVRRQRELNPLDLKYATSN